MGDSAYRSTGTARHITRVASSRSAFFSTPRHRLRNEFPRLNSYLARFEGLSQVKIHEVFASSIRRRFDSIPSYDACAVHRSHLSRYLSASTRRGKMQAESEAAACCSCLLSLLARVEVVRQGRNAQSHFHATFPLARKTSHLHDSVEKVAG